MADTRKLLRMNAEKPEESLIRERDMEMWRKSYLTERLTEKPFAIDYEEGYQDGYECELDGEEPKLYKEGKGEAYEAGYDEGYAEGQWDV